MITALHTIIYSDDAELTRAFLRDKLGWANVDPGGGWLIFRTGPSEMGVHPTRGTWEGEQYSFEKKHVISLMCDDLDATMADLEAKGVEFEEAIAEESFGRVAMMRVPGAGVWGLYEPSHPTGFDL